jgi:hypothetical protein
VRSFREQRQARLDRLYEIEAQSPVLDPDFTDIVLAYGIELHEWVVAWCSRLERQLERRVSLTEVATLSGVVECPCTQPAHAGHVDRVDGEGVQDFRDHELEVIELCADRVQQDQRRLAGTAFRYLSRVPSASLAYSISPDGDHVRV